MATWDQVSGILDRLLAMLAMWLVAKGYISASDAAQYIPLLIALAGAIWAWWINRPKAILQSAAAVPDTTVVTQAHLAAATPESNIVSANTHQVVEK